MSLDRPDLSQPSSNSEPEPLVYAPLSSPPNPLMPETQKGGAIAPADTELPLPSAPTPPAPNPTMGGWDIFNMNVGFLGIQFAWGLQMANMSAIFEHLGAKPYQIPLLWLAAPLTGLIIQPIIGNLSDYTWTPLGKRRPYFLLGAVMSTVLLGLMPNCQSLGMAVVLLWLLDMSINISMVPFRAFVGDLLPKTQRTRGFATQSVMVGLGAVSASALPWILSHWFHIDNYLLPGRKIPPTVELSFYVGAIAFLLTILWTVITTPEHPPQNMQRFEQLQEERGGVLNSITETLAVVKDMPLVMKQLAWVQCFTWLGIFCFFLYFPPAIAHTIFGAASQNSMRYNEGIEWAGVCFALFNLVCAGFSLLLPTFVRWSDRRTTHAVCLCLGGISLVALLGIHNQYWLLASMVGFGLTWASALSMPYSILIGSIPPKRQGIYQGIFNGFIVLPEIMVALGFGWVMQHWLHNDRLLAVVLSGVCLIIAAVLTLLIDPSAANQAPSSPEVPRPEPLRPDAISLDAARLDAPDPDASSPEDYPEDYVGSSHP